MQSNRSAPFRGRHFAEEIIVLCVRSYLRFSLSYRDLEELMTERGLSVDHTAVGRWVQHYAPQLDRRVRRELKRTCPDVHQNCLRAWSKAVSRVAERSRHPRELPCLIAKGSLAHRTIKAKGAKATK